jgi:hypothetical protein
MLEIKICAHRVMILTENVLTITARHFSELAFGVASVRSVRQVARSHLFVVRIRQQQEKMLANGSTEKS